MIHPPFIGHDPSSLYWSAAPVGSAPQYTSIQSLWDSGSKIESSVKVAACVLRRAQRHPFPIRPLRYCFAQFRQTYIVNRILTVQNRWSWSYKESSMAPPILSLALPSETGRVLSIQSHTVQGYVGNKSAVFPLQLLGYDVDPINSVQFSNHTGYPTFKGQVLNGQQLWDLIEGLEANDLLFYTHLLTGYIGSVSFLETVLQVVNKLRSVNPKLTYVMGDEGELYIPQELVSVYRERVVPVASMLTPNQFEAELLTGLRITSERDGLEACNILHAAGPSKVVITSVNIGECLLLIGSHKKSEGQPLEQFKIVIPKIPAYFTGTGDLITALLLGWSNKYPGNLDIASELAVSSLQALLQRTVNDYKSAGFDSQSSNLEIRLIQSQDDIRNPQVNYKAEKYT
ncbi:pyridoxal kinase isoform X2 [Macadamia integrifolia]|uniref:pyridoxal kinase isoform X2 n=1 Tax=Macadamia integrifolia TaxID=60698 RepID=UPI001C4EE6E9|nr:pyridoxal kinase isoform X2 [Macadamia integrifolia]